MTLTRKARIAVSKYGENVCVIAYQMHALDGYGASGVANEGPAILKTTQQADAAINAGREILENV